VNTTTITCAASRKFGAELEMAVTRSARMEEVWRLAKKLARASVHLTILGETGTGKDVMAQALHALGPGPAAPFVVFDCGAVAPSLVESELFGHEKGAFTGAVNGHQGAIERAHGGTLFLDEVGEFPIELQPRLLRFLESAQVRRVGGSHFRAVQVRVIAATNRDLRAEVTAQRFRQDLYFRLAAAVLELPPLRHRKEDLGILVRSLLNSMGAAHMQLSQCAEAALCAHDFPGNVRELRNMLLRAVALTDRDVITARELKLVGDEDPNCRPTAGLALGGRSLAEVETLAITQTLDLCQGNKTVAAAMLGIAVSTLYEKLRRAGYPASTPPPAPASWRPPRSPSRPPAPPLLATPSFSRGEGL
jgi:DNA-binding NtrC family response regulator